VNAKYTVVCHAPDGTFKATLQDMSVSGMRLESPRPLKPGDLLSIRCDQVYHSGAVTAVHTRVVWCARRRSKVQLGITYVDSGEVLAASWVNRLLRLNGLRSEGCVDRRRFVRVGAYVGADVESMGRRTSGTMIDLASRGLLLETREELPHGAPVVVRTGELRNAPATTFQGHVQRRARCDEAGVFRTVVRLDAQQDPSLQTYFSALLRERV